MGKKRAGAQVDELWPRVLKKIGGVGGASPNAVAVTGIVPWANVSKTGSSLAHLVDRDHGWLTGLGDDDHAQYVHVSSQRTVTARHNFSAGLTSPATDIASQFGQAHVGYVGHGNSAIPGTPTYAGFGHRDYATTGGYGFLQGGAGHGHTFVNTSPGFTIRHRVNNIDAMAMNESTLDLHSIQSFKTLTFTSGFTGNGFRLDNGVLTPGKTTGELDDLIVRGRMRVYELLVQQIRATNGSIFVSSTGKVKAVTGSGPYAIETETTHGFLVNDLIRAQRFTGNGVYQSSCQVTAVANLTNFTASLSSGDAPAAGMEFVRLGNTSDASRQNSIYMSADDTYNPFIDVIAGVNSFGAFGSNANRKLRLGRLDGLFGGTNEYGLFAGDGTGVTNKYFRLSNVTQEMHNIPIKMYDGSGNLFMQADVNGLKYYVQNTSTVGSATSLLFNRPDSTPILRLAGLYNTAADPEHVAMLWLHPGAKSSDLIIRAESPTGYFARTTIENKVAGISSQWIFKRLGDGTVGADFPGYLYVASSMGVGIAPTATLDVVRGTLGNGTAMFRGTAYASHFNHSTDEHTFIRGGKVGSSVYINDASTGHVLIAGGGGNIIARNNIELRGDDSAGASSFWIRNDGVNPVISTNVGDMYWGFNGRAGLTHYYYAGGTTTPIFLINNGGVFVNSGTARFGNGSDLFGAKIQTDGNIYALGAVATESYFQSKAQTPPAAASGYVRVVMRASDSALVAVMPSGNVRVLATN